MNYSELIRIWILLIVCIFTALGRRIGRGEKWNLDDGGWTAGLEGNSFTSWIDHGNEAVVAADKETLQQIEQKIDRLGKVLLHAL